MPRFINAIPQFFDSSGAVLTAGTITFTESGTATLIRLFADVNLKIEIANPVTLSGGGKVPNIFFPGTAAMVLRDQFGETVGQADPIGDSGSGGSTPTWSAIIVYNINDIVQGSDDKLYRSTINANSNNDPTTTGTFWAEVEFLEVWSTDITYMKFATAKASDGSLYSSLVDNNQGNDPVSSPSEWGTTGVAQTAGDIKTLYESNPDTNDFADAEKTKLGGIAANATIQQTGAQIKTKYQAESSAFTDGQFTKLGTIATGADVTATANVVSALDGAALTGVTVAGADKVLIQDASDASKLKTVTAQSIADLAASGGVTAVTASSTSDFTLTVASAATPAAFRIAEKVIATVAGVTIAPDDVIEIYLKGLRLDGTSISIATQVQVWIRINSVDTIGGHSDNGSETLTSTSRGRIQSSAVQAGTVDIYDDAWHATAFNLNGSDFVSTPGSHTIDIMACATNAQDTLLIGGATLTTEFDIKVIS